MIPVSHRPSASLDETRPIQTQNSFTHSKTREKDKQKQNRKRVDSLTGSTVILQDRKTIVLPRKADNTSPALTAKLLIVKVMEFTSQTLRSGVVVSSDDAPTGSALLFLRGAPAVIRDLVQPASVPDNFSEVGPPRWGLAGPPSNPPAFQAMHLPPASLSAVLANAANRSCNCLQAAP